MNVVSPVFSVMVVMQRLISCVSSMAMSYHVPAVSTQIGRRSEYWPYLFCAVFRAAAPGLVAVLRMCGKNPHMCLGLSHPRPWVFLWPMAGEWFHLGVCCHRASGSLVI